MRVIDSHLHLWDPAVLSYTWLDGALDWAFAEIEINEEQLQGVSEEAAIFVQADPIEEHTIDEVRWVDSIALASGVVAIVAGARLDRGAETEAHLAALAEHDRVVGVRHLLQGESDGFAGTDAFVAGARAVASRGWTFDACVRAHQIPDVTALAAAVPELGIVLDHLGKPAIGTADAPLEPNPEWLGDLRELASSPQVFCKLSGLPAETGGHWADAQVVPFLDAALAAFGEGRLMWGSDWPVSSIDFRAPDGGAYLAGARQRWFRTVADWAVSRGLDAEKIFWSNALAFYGIR
ncbi:amidohydrolase family protein [Microbacterium alcoholitolerans]|uniref:amidohydrolase family protein n=1 Tax=unclassified Microbacterium TaxID=2609290 RepID=UPI003D16727E